jgi:hypothetical protein
MHVKPQCNGCGSKPLTQVEWTSIPKWNSNELCGINQTLSKELVTHKILVSLTFEFCPICYLEICIPKTNKMHHLQTTNIHIWQYVRFTSIRHIQKMWNPHVRLLWVPSYDISD